MDYLIHYGVPGMKWGHRKARVVGSGRVKAARKQTDTKSPEEQRAIRKKRVKTAVKVGAAVAATGLAAYGAYKTTKLIKNKSMQIQMQKGREASDRIMERGHIDRVSTTTFKDGSIRVNQQKRNSSVTYTTTGNASDIHKAFKERNRQVDAKARAAYNKNVQEGAQMNTREAAKNVVDYYKKKRKK